MAITTALTAPEVSPADKITMLIGNSVLLNP
jgi:hypothetical protein